MPSLVTQTRKQLSEFASPDEFEAFATAVLREANPAYSSLVHVGTNVSGRAVRSPVDGIGVRVHPNGRHIVLVQHTITARTGLRRKWLDDKNGDVIKAKAIFNHEIARDAVRSATLVLTCTSDPDEQLIRDVHAAAGDGLEVDLWPASRIADFLDRNPEGQWLRERQFGTEATRLSAGQAHTISQQSLNDYLPLVAREDTVSRALDITLAQFARQSWGAGFVIGESGLGKSTALRRLGDAWLAQGGIALILAHEIIEQASTIEQAIALGLRYWAPALELRCGHTALALATPEQPVLLIVEDVNRSTNPRRIVERLVGWSNPGRPDTQDVAVARQWRLLCPVWRGNAGLADKQLHERVVRDSLIVDRFGRSEAVEAVRTLACNAGVALTALQGNDLAMALGDDPLLIGLNRNWLTPNPRDAIQSYVAANIDAAADAELLASDLQYGLDELVERLVEARSIYPNWRQIRSWLAGGNDSLMAIRRLIDQGKVIYLVTSSSDERLAYRHDRVRDYLLTQAMTRLIERGGLAQELWADPFYAELIGGALSAMPETSVIAAATSNPVALFAALQDASLSETRRRWLIEGAEKWIQSTSFTTDATEQQRHHAMHYLARTDGMFAAALAKRFPFSFPQLEALIRNGSARAGAALCAHLEPGSYNVWRDRVIDHALSRHPMFVPDLVELIRDGTLSPELLEGALNLAGEIGDASLCDALAARWALGDETSLSTGWLWAAIRCCSPVDHPLVDTLCDLWAELPTEVEGSANRSYLNPRWDIAGDSLPYAFNRKPERNAIAFLLTRASRDSRLNHVLNSILRQIDCPEAVLYCVQHGANVYRRTEPNGGMNWFVHELQRIWSPEQHGRVLSAESRTAVEHVWRNPLIDKFERKTAFLIWCQTPTRGEVASLGKLETDLVLADAALRTRLAAGDRSAVPLLKQRIWNDENGEYWWYEARGVGLAGLHEDVQRYFEVRNIAEEVTTADRIVAELLMDSCEEFAAQVIIENWDQLKVSPSFVQAALYLAIPETVGLAQSAIASSKDPGKMLEHIDMHWGIRTSGRRGFTDLAQLQALEPYFVQMSEMKMGGMLINSFFTAANGLGALSWREEHLDPLIAKVDQDCCTSAKETLFDSLDREVANYLEYNRRWFPVNHWFERREEELWERSELLSIMGSWASARDSEAAVEMLCEALLHFGERQDLTLFDQISPALSASCAGTIANCVYGVRRRSLGAKTR